MARISDEVLELRLGLALLAVGALLGILLLIGAAEKLSTGATIHVDFDDLTGLRQGGPVEVSGRRIGRVTIIKLAPSPGEPPLLARARVDIRIDRDALHLVRRNSEIYVGRHGLIGQSYVEVGPPRQPQERAGAVVQDGAVLRGVDAPPVDELLAKSFRTLELTTQFLHEEGPVIHEALASVSALRATTAGVAPPGIFGRVAGQSRDLVGETIGLFLTIRTATDDFAATDRIGAHWSHIAQRSDRIGPLASKASAGLSMTLGMADLFSPERVRAIQRLPAVVRAILARIAAMIADADVIIDSIVRGDVSIGKLLQDRELVDEIKETQRLLKANPLRALGKPSLQP